MENSTHGYSEGSEPIKLTIEVTVARLNEHALNVAGVIPKQDIKSGAELILELADQLKQRDETIKQLKEALKEATKLREQLESIIKVTLPK